MEKTEAAAYRALFGDKKTPVCSVRAVTGDGRAASAALSVAHAALLLSGELSGEVSACTLGNAPEAVKLRAENCRTVLVTACSVGGSFAAVLLRKI